MVPFLAALAAAAAPLPVPPKPAVPARPTISQEDHKARGARCGAMAESAPEKAIDEAKVWQAAGGGMAARQCLGIAQSNLGQWREATDSFEAAAKDALLDDNQMTVVLWMQAGNAALAADEPVRAKGSFDRALLIPGLSDEMKGEVHLDRARANVAANDVASARVDLEQATKLVPRDPLGWLLRANLARKAKDLPLAFAAIREATKLAPNDPSVAYEAGNIAAASGHMDDARAAWTRAATAAPDSNAGKAAALALRGEESEPQP